MQSTFSYFAKWLASLGREITRVTPSATATSVIASLAAQVSLLITFLLPLKILMLMSTNQLPAFLPEPIQAIGLRSFVLLLCVSTLLFYLVQITATKISEKSSKKGAQKLLESANKVLLFDNQKELAKNAYHQFSGLLSCLIFCITSISVLFYFYPELATIILMCPVLLFHVHKFLCKSECTFSQLNNSQLAFIINSSVGASFFIVFLFIVIDFLYLSPPNFLIALGSFILSRQIIANLGTIVRHAYALTKNHDKINALFFHHHVLESSGSEFDSPLWRLLEDNQYQWFHTLFEDHLGLEVNETSISWLDTGLSNLGFFDVDLNKGKKRFLVKVFDSAAQSQASHEETLLQDLSFQKLITPPLLSTDSITGVKCHIYDLTEMPVSSLDGQWAKELDIFKELLLLSPSSRLIKQYSRSKQTLPDRFGVRQLKYLKLASSQEEKSSVDQFINMLDQLLTILRNLPLWFINPQINQIVAIRNDNATMIIHWGKWELEPTGAGWPVSYEKLELIAPSIKQAGTHRHELTAYPVDFYHLAALTYALERDLLNFRFKKALNLIREINNIMEKQESTPPILSANGSSAEN